MSIPKFKAGNLGKGEPGDLVKVHSRRGPGMNKPGGVASIIAVSTEVDSVTGDFLYDVKYMLGSKEKRVPERYIKAHRLGVDNPMSSQEPSVSGAASGDGDEDDEIAPSDVDVHANTTPVHPAPNRSNVQPNKSLQEEAKRLRVINDTSSEHESSASDVSPPPSAATNRGMKRSSPLTKQELVQPSKKPSPSNTTTTSLFARDKEVPTMAAKLLRPSVSIDLQQSDSSDEESFQEEKPAPVQIKSSVPPRGVVPDSSEDDESDDEASCGNEEEDQQPIQQQVMVKTPSIAPKVTSTSLPPSNIPPMQEIELPTGPSGAAAKYLLDTNRPFNSTNIAHALKEKYSKAQVENALTQLLNKRLISTLEDGSKIYWFNQDKLPVESANDGKKIEERSAALLTHTQALEASRDELQGEIRNLMAEPGDSELAKVMAEQKSLVQALAHRAKEMDDLAATAAQMGKTASELQDLNNAELKNRLLFYRGQWRDRKARVSEFLANIADGKGLKPAAKKELVEKIGIETDEDAKVVFRKGLELG